jgi:hypothetical protein
MLSDHLFSEVLFCAGFSEVLFCAGEMAVGWANSAIENDEVGRLWGRRHVHVT